MADYINKLDEKLQPISDEFPVDYAEHKQGLTWVSAVTGQMRYADKEGYDQWVQQLPRYFASVSLARGTPVSLNNKGLLVKSSPDDKNPCIGLTLEPVNVGKDKTISDSSIHVQPYGLFDFSIGGTSLFKKGDSIYIGKNGSLVARNNNEQLYVNSNIKYIGVMVSDNVISITLRNDERAPYDSTKYVLACDTNFSSIYHPKVCSFITPSPQEFKCSIVDVNYKPEYFDENEYVLIEQGNAKIVFSVNGDLDAGYPSSIKYALPDGTTPEAVINTITTVLKHGTKSQKVDNVYTLYTDSGNGIEPTYIRLSSKINKYLICTVISEGSLGTKDMPSSRVGLADIRRTGKQDIVGVYEPNSETGTAGQYKATFVRTGIVSYDSRYSDFFEKLSKGDKLYLEKEGTLVTDVSPLYNKIIQIGTYMGKYDEDSTYKILVDCSSREFSRATTYPTGFMRVCYGTEARPSYLLMDGKTPISSEAYPKLFAFLVDNGIINVDATVLPSYKTLDDAHYFEIKYTDEGISDLVPEFPYKVFTSVFEAKRVGTGAEYEATVFNSECTNLDITSLVGVANAKDISISDFDIRLYVNLNTDGSENWVELKSGYTKFEGSTQGFEWSLSRKGETVYITADTDTSDGGTGITYIAGSGEGLRSLVNHSYRVIVTLRRMYQREFDVGFIERLIHNRTTHTSDITDTFVSTIPTSNILSVSYNLNHEDGVADVQFKKNGTPTATIQAGNLSISSLARLKRLYGERIIGELHSLGSDFEGAGTYTQEHFKSDNFYSTDYGSALQAAYEIPLAIWQYRADPETNKKRIGIVIDRVKDAESSYKGEKGSVTQGARDIATISSEKLTYNYSDDQKASIAAYADSIVDDTDSGMSTTSTLGLLLKAAAETQSRLLSLEEATYGLDAKTIPGGKALVNGKEKSMTIKDTDINSDPTYYGNNRLIRAISKELFGHANPYGTNAFDTSDNTPISRLDTYGIEIYGAQSTGGNNKDFSDFDVTEVTSSTYPYVIGDGEAGTGIKSKKTKSDTGDNGKTTFNGINDAVGRIVKKVNRITESINGTDNINVVRDTDTICTYSWTAPTSL